MNELTHLLEKASRLESITQKVGFTLWQIQELEGASAQLFALLAQASRGMGLTAGTELVDRAKRKTFGATIHKLAKAELLSEGLEDQFGALLAERNWLVHSSRSDSRNAVHGDQAMQQLTERLDAMADMALSLLKEVGSMIEAHVYAHGVSKESVDDMTSELLAHWRSADST